MTAFVQSQLPQRPVLPPEPPPGTVITWQQQFAPDGPVYTYAAVSVPFRGWYASDASDASETPYTWAELFYWLIGDAPVYAAASWWPL